MTNDDALSREQFKAIPLGDLIYILAKDNDDPIALFLLRGEQLDYCFMPWAWGSSIKVGIRFIEWAWSNLGIKQITGETPTYNRLALKLAKAVGFQVYGRTPNAGTKNGKLYDLILLRMQRPAYVHKSVA